MEPVGLSGCLESQLWLCLAPGLLLGAQRPKLLAEHLPSPQNLPRSKVAIQGPTWHQLLHRPLSPWLFVLFCLEGRTSSWHLLLMQHINLKCTRSASLR